MGKKGTYVSHDTRINEIIKQFEYVGYKHGISTVFNDYLTIFSCAVSNAVDKVHFEEREALYMQTKKKYSEEELDKIANIHYDIVNALEQSIYSSDLLGEIYHSLNLSNSGNGQFFTPIHIAHMMAQMIVGNSDKEIHDKGYISLLEPTCGSGVMVIAAANSLYQNHHNPSHNMCVMAVDNDIRCVMMAYIQLSYLGIPAVVIHGDSLSVKEYTRFYTPLYILGGWLWKQPLGLTDSISKVDLELRKHGNPLVKVIDGILNENESLVNE